MQPEKLSPYLKNLIDRTDSPALKRQFLPSEDEKILSPYDTGDPLAEERFSLTPFLVHRYPDRALWLTTPQCAAACRYCFRKSADAFRRTFNGTAAPFQQRAPVSFPNLHTDSDGCSSADHRRAFAGAETVPRAVFGSYQLYR